ncbi:hypothetical protein PAXRUDRAFT_36817 [Paxillus rubicundulus Ve08.2h10]|uniref:CxC6 like cysteine cluster associated with KDZ domain-containing protein n=1 Tax=Paxillus rubicundulus Ve08.2h10 TaxID=930991 RepID=A0A0D0D0Z0_9AGAM|nr:hypothetical protein PAXRUDRAFT_36817 [Paxillus rubicundulus Ve08.2h10]
MKNCARLYNLCLGMGITAPSSHPVSFELNSEVLFYSCCLKTECNHIPLNVSHGGNQNVCFRAAMQACNCHWFIPVVCFFGCQIPLANNKHWFCPEDRSTQEGLCAIAKCNVPVVKGQCTCSSPEHQQVEDVYHLWCQSQFQLQNQLERAQLAFPDDSIAQDVDIADIIDLSNTEEEFELDIEGGVHPSELIVAPCSVIRYQTTYYSAEGVASVTNAYTHDQDLKLTHIFYDNNCHLAKHVKSDPYFKGIGLSVDLKGENGQGWYLNSSITEQTNTWLGGFHSICWEMLVDKFNFLLDELIMQCNHCTLEKLERDGHIPNYWLVLHKFNTITT